MCNTADENLTFRGNTLATKSIDTYMKMVGKNYLRDTLGGFVNAVYENEEDTEVDPQKIPAFSPNNTNGSTTSNPTSSNSSAKQKTPSNSANSTLDLLTTNQRFLESLLQNVWKCITDSLPLFPARLRRVFSAVRDRCAAQGQEPTAQKIASASLFLRFLCPAILSPSLFQLSREYPSERAARTLTLIAKTIQNLANFTRFGAKESYMEFLNDFVEREMPNMDVFLGAVSSRTINADVGVFETPNSSVSCSAGENTDLSRALSVLYHILQAEIPSLSKEGREKLTELMPLLRRIAEIHQASPKVDELRLSRPFETAASVCSKPLTTPLASRDDQAPSLVNTRQGVNGSDISRNNSMNSESLLMTANSKVDSNHSSENTSIYSQQSMRGVDNNDCYRDTELSLNEDFILPSGASGLSCHSLPSPAHSTRNSPSNTHNSSRNLAKLNEGRGTIDRKKLQLSSRSTPDINGGLGSRRSKSVDNHQGYLTMGSAAHGKSAKINTNNINTNKNPHQIPPQNTESNNNNHGRSELSLNSLKRRQFENQQQQQHQQQQLMSPTSTPKSPMRKGGKESVKDRINLFSHSNKHVSAANGNTSTPPSTPTNSSNSNRILVSPKSTLANKTFLANNSGNSNNDRNNTYNQHSATMSLGKKSSSSTLEPNPKYYSLKSSSKTSPLNNTNTNHINANNGRNSKTNTLPSSKSSSMASAAGTNRSGSSSIPAARFSASSANSHPAIATPPGLRKPPHQSTNTPPPLVKNHVSINNNNSKDKSPPPIAAKKPLAKSQSLVLSPKPSIRPKPISNQGDARVDKAASPSPSSHRSTTTTHLSLQRPVKKSAVGGSGIESRLQSSTKVTNDNSDVTNTNNISKKEERQTLTLSNLKKEHHFHDNEHRNNKTTTAAATTTKTSRPEPPLSPAELLSYERSPKHSFSDQDIFATISNNMNTSSNAILPNNNNNTTSARLQKSRRNGYYDTDSDTNNDIGDMDDITEVSWGSQLKLPTKQPKLDRQHGMIVYAPFCKFLYVKHLLFRTILYLELPSTSNHPLSRTTLYFKPSSISNYLLFRTILYLELPSTSNHPLSRSTLYVELPSISNHPLS